MISQDIYELPNVQTNFWETYGVHRIQQKLWISFFCNFYEFSYEWYLNRNLYFDPVNILYISWIQRDMKLIKILPKDFDSIVFISNNIIKVVA